MYIQSFTIVCCLKYNGRKMKELVRKAQGSVYPSDFFIYISLGDANFLEGVHHVDAVLHQLGHGHLVAVEDALDGNFLALTLRVELGLAHAWEVILGHGCQTVDESFVCFNELLKHGFVVQNIGTTFFLVK